MTNQLACATLTEYMSKALASRITGQVQLLDITLTPDEKQYKFAIHIDDFQHVFSIEREFIASEDGVTKLADTFVRQHTAKITLFRLIKETFPHVYRTELYSITPTSWSGKVYFVDGTSRKISGKTNTHINEVGELAIEQDLQALMMKRKYGSSQDLEHLFEDRQ